MIDLVVAGGGPAGLATALHAHRRGLDVVVHEPRALPLDKACGEGLMPGAVTALAALDVHPEGQPLAGLRYVAGRHRATADFGSGPGLGVRRTALQHAMRAAVADAGVPVVDTPVSRVEQDADGVVVDGRRARYLVAADGLHSPLRRGLGLELPAAGPRRFGLRRHFELPPWTSYVEVHWADSSEAYVTPVGERLVGVAVLTRRRAGYDEQLAAFPELRERLAGAPATDARGAGPLRQRTRRRVAGRVLLVGDAAGYVDALTGEGIALGVAQASAAVSAIAAGRPEDYERAWRQVSRRYRLLTEGLLRATGRPRVRAALVPAAERLPSIFARAVDALAGPA